MDELQNLEGGVGGCMLMNSLPSSNLFLSYHSCVNGKYENKLLISDKKGISSN